MFCRNCGNELTEDAQVCDKCGENLNHAEKSKTNVIWKNKKVIISVVSVMVVLIAVIIFFAVINNVNASPEKVAVTAVKSTYAIDIDTYLKCFSKFTLKEIAAHFGLSTGASRREITNCFKALYRYETPKNVTIISTSEIARYNVAQYNINFNTYMTASDYKSIKNVVTVKVDFLVDGVKDSITATCIDMNGKWYVVDIDN